MPKAETPAVLHGRSTCFKATGDQHHTKSRNVSLAWAICRNLGNQVLETGAGGIYGCVSTMCMQENPVARVHRNRSCSLCRAES